MDINEIDGNTAAWNAQVWICFALSFALTAIGVALVPADLWARGYLLMGLTFTVGSTFSLAKTVRDNAEHRRLRNRLKAARTEKILRDFELQEAAK